MSDVSRLLRKYETALRGERQVSTSKLLFTIGFALISSALTWHATGSLSAGGAVLFGLWSVAGIVEINA